MGTVQVRSFTAKCDGLANVLLSESFISQAFNPIVRPDHITFQKFNAIWDTGATNSVITENVVKKCGLSQIDFTQSHTASGIRTSKVFLVSLRIPNNIIFPSVRVTDGNIAGGVDILIGMDIISKGDFAISNFQGKTVFTFRMPSIELTDYVTNSHAKVARPTEHKKYPGTNRNDICPCGSGKKYKRCCGREGIPA